MTWAVGATDNPMGQQHYESEIQRALLACSNQRDWSFRPLRLAPVRSQFRGARRMPARLLARSGHRVARAVGSATYPRGGFVHRFDLRLPPAGGREVVTAHDLPPLRFDDEGPLPSWIGESARSSFGVITPSTFAASEISELLGVQRTWVIPYGLSAPYLNPRGASAQQLHELRISGRYVVHAAGASARKNLGGLAEAWPVVHRRTGATLVMAGPPDARRDRLFVDMPGVLMIGKQLPELIAGLMVEASAVVVPSLYEGFGLPALEGMACGTPVVAARRGALPEVCEDAALLVDPSGPGLAEGLTAALDQPEVSGRLRVEGPRRAATFSWSVAAERHFDVYEELATACG